MRALESWASSFRQNFPSESDVRSNGKYWNEKLPTHQAMVEGKYSTTGMKRQVAQLLINGCHHLVTAKPAWAANIRVTCVIALPNMFSSEICIYTSEDYFGGHVQEGIGSNGVTVSRIVEKKLSHLWDLSLPQGVAEVGVRVCFPGHGSRGEDSFAVEHWFYGEVT
jgi:hypothetical protein